MASSVERDMAVLPLVRSVPLSLKQDISAFMALMRHITSSNQEHCSYARGIKILVELWRKYKRRLPVKVFQEHLLQIADFLFGIKLFQLAHWHGYCLLLFQFTSVKIMDITDVTHFMASFFPEGFDADQDTFSMKIRAMYGCAMCAFEEEKKKGILSEERLNKVLQLLNFIRITMQAIQQNEHYYRQIYDGSLHIYSICRYLMTMKCSTQALEYLLWASISVEMSIPLMTAKYLSGMVTLSCAVCHCYYDNQAGVQAEEFARRALGKINALAKQDEQSNVSITREARRAYKEASIKLGSMVFKRAVFEGRKKTKYLFKPKTSVKEATSGPWPCSQTERMLSDLFDCRAGQFLAILEALQCSNARPLQGKMPDDPDLQEVVIELQSAGISILSGCQRVTNNDEQGSDNHPCLSPTVLTKSSNLLDKAIKGEDTVPIMSAVRFIKLFFQYRRPDCFVPELIGEILPILSGFEGHLFRKAERELVLLNSYHMALSSQMRLPREDNKCKSSPSLDEELTSLVRTLYESTCVPVPKEQVDGDLVLQVVVYVWTKLKRVIVRNQLNKVKFEDNLQTIGGYDELVLGMSVLCMVAYACDLVIIDSVMTLEMTIMLRILLDSGHECFTEAQHRECNVKKPNAAKCSPVELLQKMRETAERGQQTVRWDMLQPPLDSSTVTDFAYMQKWNLLSPSTSPTELSSSLSEEENETDGSSLEESEKMESKIEPDSEDFQQKNSTFMYLIVKDLHLELDRIYHKASLLLLHLDAVSEDEVLNKIKYNKVSKALFLIQKASLTHKDPLDSSKTIHLLQEASTLIEKASIEERKVYMANCHTPSERQSQKKTEEEEKPPPPPILLSRTDHSFTFIPAPYNLEDQVCWYQLSGRAAEGVKRKVHLVDYDLPGTGNMVPVVSGDCVLTVEGLEPNQKYVFAVAAYNSRGKLLGNSVGATTLPLLASMPVPLLYPRAYLAQVAFQTGQYAIAKRACSELWSHYVETDSEAHSAQDRFATTRLRKQTLQHSSRYLCQLVLSSIFMETDINIQQGSLYCNSFSENGPFVWEQEARLAECERMLVAMDFAMYINDSGAALQAAVACYGLLTPLIFHQIIDLPVVQVLKKCLVVMEENSRHIKQNMSETYMHMIASITYYLSKALRVLGEHEVAAVAMDCGRRLLQRVYDCQRALKGDTRISHQLLSLHMKSKNRLSPDAVPTPEEEITRPLTGSEEPSLLYELIFRSPLDEAYQDVMALKRASCFPEISSLLLQRAMEEGKQVFVLEWGKTILQILSSTKKVSEGTNKTKKKKAAKAVKENDVSKKTKEAPSTDEMRKKLKQKMPPSMLKKLKTNREIALAENLLNGMTYFVQRNKKDLQRRMISHEQSVWKSYVNYIMAQAQLALLYSDLETLLGGSLQHRYPQFNPLYFSLANTGIMVQRNPQQGQPSKRVNVDERQSSQSASVTTPKKKKKKKSNKKDGVCDDAAKEGSSAEEEGSAKHVEQKIETQEPTAAFVALTVVALHLRRAMVLAHRDNHWTFLQFLCQTVWDQNSALILFLQRTFQLESSPPITADEFHSVFTPLLVVATDLIMDMLNKLGLWNICDGKRTDEELETNPDFKASLEANVQVDLHWVRNLVLYTLAQLYESGKWETLAHFTLLFNSYTKDQYALIVMPILIDAQKKLLERISSVEGPAVPQPHHVKTLKITGNKISCRNYTECRLLCGSRPQSGQKQANRKKVSIKTILSQQDTELKDVQLRLALSLVCVPLDVEDTQRCYDEALKTKPHCLQVFYHARSLLALLLAHTQPFFVTQSQLSDSTGLRHSPRRVDFSPAVNVTPTSQHCDVPEDGFKTLTSMYSLPISPDNMPVVVAAYSDALKSLQASNYECLRVEALHEAGNLHFYNGNTRAAHSCWSKAVDCALQSSGVLDRWDGVSYGGGSTQQTLKQAGIWGCLQAAVLAAKIAQYILTFDVSQRTTCCLLSAHLFKCVLSGSVGLPKTDLQYASYVIVNELFPGIDLFSGHHRNNISSAVISLSFICHWLFTKGYYIMVLPVIALQLHFVGDVCRDVQRTVDCKILKIRVLTQLCLFTEAVLETCELTQGLSVLWPYGQYIVQTCLKPMNMFYIDKHLSDNAEALEELVSCDFAPEVRTLYGPTLCIRLNLARAQLVLALTNSECGSAESASTEDFRSPSPQFGLATPEEQEEDTTDIETSIQNEEEQNADTAASEKQKHSPESIKLFLHEEVSSLLHSISQQLVSHYCSEMESLELTIELNLLKANLHLQQGHPELSTEVVISCLELLQMSETADERAITGLTHVSVSSGGHNDYKDERVPNGLQEDCPRAVEASERVGASLWLRCRLALFHSLTASSQANTVPFPDKNYNDEATVVLHEGIKECALWGDHDTQAILMVLGAELEAKRGRTEGSMTMLQTAVSLLSGRTHMPPGSTLTLARAALLLSDLRGAQSMTLLQLTQKLLKKQLSVFGQSVRSVDRNMCVLSSGLNNIYLPYLHMLDQMTLRIATVTEASLSQSLMAPGNM